MRHQIKISFIYVPLSVLFATCGNPCSANNALQPAEKAFSEKRYERACELLAPLVIGTQKQNPSAHYLYANALAQSRRTVDAIAEFRQTLKLSPNQDVRRKSLYMVDACQKVYSSSLPEWCLTKNVPEAQGFIGLKFDAEHKVAKVFSGSPAKMSGILVGDWIKTVNGEQVTPKTNLAHLIKGAVGSRVKLEIERAGSQLTFDLERAVCVPEQLKESTN